jgi:hypothetical protein
MEDGPISLTEAIQFLSKNFTRPPPSNPRASLLGVTTAIRNMNENEEHLAMAAGALLMHMEQWLDDDAVDNVADALETVLGSQASEMVINLGDDDHASFDGMSSDDEEPVMRSDLPSMVRMPRGVSHSRAPVVPVFAETMTQHEADLYIMNGGRFAITENAPLATTPPAVATTPPAVATTPPAVATTPPAVATTPPAVATTPPAVATTPPAVATTPHTAAPPAVATTPHTATTRTATTRTATTRTATTRTAASSTTPTLPAQETSRAAQNLPGRKKRKNHHAAAAASSSDDV